MYGYFHMLPLPCIFAGIQGDKTTDGAFDRTHGGGGCERDYGSPPCPDAFVTKLNASGGALVYSTYLGGSGSDWGYSKDGQGNSPASSIG